MVELWATGTYHHSASSFAFVEALDAIHFVPLAFGAHHSFFFVVVGAGFLSFDRHTHKLNAPASPSGWKGVASARLTTDRQVSRARVASRCGAEEATEAPCAATLPTLAVVVLATTLADFLTQLSAAR